MVNAIVQIEQLKNNRIALNVTSIDLILLIAINLQDLENLRRKKKKECPKQIINLYTAHNQTQTKQTMN